MSALAHLDQHPIIGCAADIGAALKAVAAVEPVFMTVEEKQSALVSLTEVRSAFDGLMARVLAASDDVGDAHGSSSTRTSRPPSSRGSCGRSRRR